VISYFHVKSRFWHFKSGSNYWVCRSKQKKVILNTNFFSKRELKIFLLVVYIKYQYINWFFYTY